MRGRHRYPVISAKLRGGHLRDLDALLALERLVFRVDVLSRRSLRHFLASPGAALIVAEENGRLAGYALVLFPSRSAIARLYSIAVAPRAARRGVGPLLLAAAEKAAVRRRRRVMRLEVHEHNSRAITRYKKSGYRLFGTHRDYYDDRGDALRFEKPLRTPAGSIVTAKKPDAQRRIGFHGGHCGPRSRNSVRSRL